MKKKVLITGGCGFIGKNLITKLEKNNYLILSIGRHLNENIVMDLNDVHLENILSDFNPDIIFHLASGSNIKKANENPEKEFKDVVNGTNNLISSIKKIKPKRIIYLSSQAVYGEPSSLPATEEHTLNPITVYGEYKLKAENLISNSNIDYTIFRIPSLYGYSQDPNKSGVISIFLNLLRQNKSPIIFNDMNSFIDLIYINDVIDGILCSLDNEHSKNNIFNLSSGEKITFNEIIKILYKYFPNAPLPEVKESSVYKKNKFNGIILDNSRIKDLLLWKPKYNFEKGIEEILISKVKV